MKGGRENKRVLAHVHFRLLFKSTGNFRTKWMLQLRGPSRKRTFTFNFGPNAVFQESVHGCTTDFVSGVSCVNKALNVPTRALPRPTDKSGPTETKERQKKKHQNQNKRSNKDQKKLHVSRWIRVVEGVNKEKYYLNKPRRTPRLHQCLPTIAPTWMPWIPYRGLIEREEQWQGI